MISRRRFLLNVGNRFILEMIEEVIHWHLLVVGYFFF